MASKGRACPACGEVMVYRLGELSCPGCGHVEEAARDVRQRLWEQEPRRPFTPSSATKRPLAMPGPFPRGAPLQYSLEDMLLRTQLISRKPTMEPLAEKRVLVLVAFLLSAAWLVLIVYLPYLDPLYRALPVVFFLFGVLVISPLIYAVVLGKLLWMKWALLIWNSVVVVSSVGLLIAYGMGWIYLALSRLEMFEPIVATTLKVAFLAHLAYTLWLASILQRDIQRIYFG